MLKSTGYFRAIECPFREGCRRPHCHFRHRGRGLGSAGSGGARSGAEYDPCSPDLPTVPPCLDDGILEVALDPSQDILELERVNKAIEEAKNEVEREQRKYEKLLGTQNDHTVTLKKSSQSDFSPLEYDPGGSGTSSSCYNPTPLTQSVKQCKYTLDDLEDKKSKSRFLEYVPKVVTSVSKYKTNKYVIDNSKPHTDMEYDPMSNYSARHLSKAKHQKGNKRGRTNSQDEGYAISSKKSCYQTTEMPVEAKFSDSEEDLESQYSQSASKPLHSGTKQSVSLTDKSSKSGTTDECTVKEIAVQYDMGDIGQTIKSHSKDLKKKSLKNINPKYDKKDLVKKPSGNVDSGKSKGLCKEGTKEKHKSIVKKKPGNVNVKNRENKLGDHKKTKTESRPHEKNGSEKLNKETSSGKTLVVAKCNKKNREVKGKDKTCTNVKKDPRGKVGDVNGIHKVKKSKSLVKSKEPVQGIVKAKTKQRTLSHVDLFGDESSEEDENQKNNPLNRNSNSVKGEKSAHSSKVTSRRTSASSVDSSEIDYGSLEKNLDSDSDQDPLEECLRVFNESKDVKTEDKGRMGKQLNEDSDEKSELGLTTLIPGQKRRISHVTSTDSTSKPVIRPYRRPTPQEICYQRIQQAQEQATQLLEQQQQAIKLTRNVQKSSPNLTVEKKRIAHMPGSSSYLSLSSEAKNPKSGGSTATCNGSSLSLKLRTLSGMTSKTTSATVHKRRAHVPSLQSAALKRPVIPNEFGAKVPTTVRQRYLNLFIDECLKFCLSQQEAFDKALEEEKVVYSRSSSRNIYLNVAVNTLKKLRSQGSEEKTVSPKILNKKAVSHESVLGGKLAAKTSFSVQRSVHREEELTDASLYRKLKEYVLSPEQLKEHGYPLAHPDKPGRAVVFTTEEKKSLDSPCRICCRCGAEYLVTPSGNCVRREECIHHWGRLRRQRAPGGWETHYNCCSGAVGSTGCQVAKQHVQDGRKENLDGFVKTFEKLETSNENPGVYALDCEMCYTTKGLELTRVTVINSQLKVVYDTFVQPDNKIVDYNTRFSGVTEEDLQNTSITLRDVQAVLLCMFSCDTILIGHSLESDLYALKLIHPTVVDTAVVFPHRLGLPYKRALRSLMADHLKRIIQDSVEGHDSSEDACSCMELMIWRIKEDAKVKR
ncbi:RNA exonuclease 1 homolog [Pseudophryne corroboree]|uniref:RNA exonuclease 1 homolog n=1 Tax=Pseudophryne corroboree TaxID=495146 RepID=UPI00308159E4